MMTSHRFRFPQMGSEGVPEAPPRRFYPQISQIHADDSVRKSALICEICGFKRLPVHPLRGLDSPAGTGSVAGMDSYSDFIDRLLLNSDVLKKLLPTEPLNWDLPGKIRDATDETLSGGKEIGDRKIFALVRGGLFYAADALEDGHRIFQDAPGDLGSYWHGMMHRREGDFDNARYWFRRAGRLPVAHKLHSAACEYSPNMARQETWDAYLLTGLCEQAKFGAQELVGECIKLQRVEFDGLFAYCWRQAVGD